MVESFIPIGLCRELCYQVVALESRALVRLILAETIRLIAQIFHQKARIFKAVAYACIRLERVVAAVRGVQLGGESRGNGRRHHINSATGGKRTVLHLTAPLQHLDGIHAPGIGEIIGRGSGIRRRSSQHSVLHE